MIRRDDSQPGLRRAFTASIAPLIFLAGCSEQAAVAPPQAAPVEAPAKKPATGKASSRPLQPDEPGYSGKGG